MAKSCVINFSVAHYELRFGFPRQKMVRKILQLLIKNKDVRELIMVSSFGVLSNIRTLSDLEWYQACTGKHCRVKVRE